MQKMIALTGVTLLILTACKGDSVTDTAEPDQKSATGATTQVTEKSTPDPIQLLRTHLSLNAQNQPALAEQDFATMPLTKEQAEKATSIILEDRLATLRAERKKEFDQKIITHAGKTMKYDYKIYGKEPAGGHSLYISMHGGGNAPAKINEQQWRNQLALYRPKEGIYLAPRAPTDTWDLWHQSHIDPMFDQLIADFIAFKGINPDKVYIMGYSAGGDGCYQLAPRMADRWAGAAMMAGHPGDAQTWNLRNLPFIIQCGAKDNAYNRANLCLEWGRKLGNLATSDPGGYPNKCIVYPQHGHWMKLECQQAVPWMAQYTRNPWPKKLHWYQDNTTHTRFYWLSNKNPKHKQLISAEVKENTITLYHSTFTIKHSPSTGAGDFTEINTITLRLSDKLLDMDKPIVIKNGVGDTLLEKKAHRTIATISQSIHQRPDPSSAATATITINF